MSLRAWLPPPFVAAFDRRRGARRARETRPLLDGRDRLHLGCGSHLLEGWANVDMLHAPGLFFHDLRDPLPIADGAVGFVYAEHFIEHIPRPDALKLLCECLRVLRPGGVLRLSTPNLAVIVEEYRAGRVAEWTDVGWSPATPGVMLNEALRLWGHEFVYDAPEIRRLLDEAGFVDVIDVPWRESAHPELRQLECRPYHRDLIVEASAPYSSRSAASGSMRSARRAGR